MDSENNGIPQSDNVDWGVLKDYAEQIKKNKAQLIDYLQPYKPDPHPCPSCGRCPTCGRGGYWQWPTYPQITWTSGGSYRQPNTGLIPFYASN